MPFEQLITCERSILAQCLPVMATSLSYCSCLLCRLLLRLPTVADQTVVTSSYVLQWRLET
eukprot:m.26429 g.26429  ORF g.26429 m.26429 type:complete len:61 (+) comp13766_c0_seq3:814-996(+)